MQQKVQPASFSRPSARSGEEGGGGERGGGGGVAMLLIKNDNQTAVVTNASACIHAHDHREGVGAGDEGGQGAFLPIAPPPRP